MSCKGNGGASETEPWLVQQPLEESSLLQTFEREQGYIRPRIPKRDLRKLTKKVKEQVNDFKAKPDTPAHTIGEYPKAKSNSSSRVKGLQLMTSVAGLPVGKNQRRRTRNRKRKIASYGSMDAGPLSHVKRVELSQEFPSSQILERIPLSGAKLKSLTKKIPGSWLEPGNDKDKQDFLREANVLALSIDRGKKRIVAFQQGSNGKYLTPGICPLHASTGTSVRALNELGEHEHDALFRYVRKCEKLAMTSMSLEITRGFNMAKKIFPFQTFPGRGKHDRSCHAFSSIATALNVCLNSHTDNDSFYGVVTDLDADPIRFPRLDDEVALYFTFPTLGLAIALRPGDILVFNPAVYHSVSSRRNPSQDIWCTSLYTKNTIVGGNDNSLEIESVQKEAINIARSMV